VERPGEFFYNTPENTTEKDTPMTANEAQPSTLRKWITAGRPWALPASTMPVLFGTSLAVVIGGAPLQPIRFLLAFLAMVILHTAANMLSDVYDFRRGLDRDVTPVSGAVVRGWLTPEQVQKGAFLLFALGCALGLVIALLTGWTLFYVGLVGVAIGAAYSFLKYRALGDLAVFLNFGILGGLGSWIVQTRTFSWIPVLWTIPMAMLVVGILHANNWRDTVSDTELRVKTMASIYGDRGSLAYYGFLLFGSMAIVLFVFMIGPRLIGGGLVPMPWTFAVVLLALPEALRLWGRALRRRTPRQPMDFVILDGATAQYNLQFGLLCTAAVWIQALLAKL
jgi:1,4-dihydroxy-2-naphthoate octaprenyltransferase